MASTGSARRQSYKFAPTSRMSNTFIAAGTSTPQEIIANTDTESTPGIWAEVLSTPPPGISNFAVNEGYIVKDGKIVKPVRGATLIGRDRDPQENRHGRQ